MGSIGDVAQRFNYETIMLVNNLVATKSIFYNSLESSLGWIDTLEDSSEKDSIYHLFNPFVLIEKTPEDENINQMVIDEIKLLLNKKVQWRNNYYDNNSNSIERMIDGIEENECLEKFMELSTWIDEAECCCNGFDCKSHVNLYRQAFITLITIFDSVVFDIAKAIINDNFFDFLKTNKMDKKYKLEDIINLNSFEAFKCKVVEEILKENYAFGLLEMMYKYNSSYFQINTFDRIKDIYEVLARRNIHIHNRGIVDEQYLIQSRGKNYNLKLGDYAYIGYIYIQNTCEILSNFINNINNDN